MNKHIDRAGSGALLVLVFALIRCGWAAEPVLLTIRGIGVEPISLTATQLAQLPSRSVKTTEQDGNQVEYRGVAFSELLHLIKVPRGRDLRGEWLSRHLVVKASDGYVSVFALPELDPEFSEGPVLLCYSKNGAAIPASEGPLRIVMPSEKRHSRWVRQVNELRLMD